MNKNKEMFTEKERKTEKWIGQGEETVTFAERYSIRKWRKNIGYVPQKLAI